MQLAALIIWAGVSFITYTIVTKVTINIMKIFIIIIISGRLSYIGGS